MRLILLGAPGAGKGTQAEKICEHFGIPHISTGDIFRSNIKNGTDLGKKAKEYMDKGMLVPDELTIEIVKDRLVQDDCGKGFILDGFPRTIPQAEYLDKALWEMDTKISVVLNIHVDDEVIIERMSGRRFCPGCGMTYHTIYKKSATEDVCDKCQTALMIRDDDKKETVVKRLHTYHEQTEPLIAYYGKQGLVKTVIGSSTIEETSQKVMEALEA